ncbi:hypothetical protein D3C84_940880 [compost metagenome]
MTVPVHEPGRHHIEERLDRAALKVGRMAQNKVFHRIRRDDQRIVPICEGRPECLSAKRSLNIPSKNDIVVAVISRLRNRRHSPQRRRIGPVDEHVAFAIHQAAVRKHYRITP